MLLIVVPLAASSSRLYEVVAAVLLIGLNIARTLLIAETTKATHANRYSCAELALLQLDAVAIANNVALLVIDNAIHTLFGVLGTAHFLPSNS